MTESCRILRSRETLTLLRSLRDVLILIHRSPDGDCIGGGYALYYMLQQLGIRSRVLCADPIPAQYHDITDGVTFADFPPQCVVTVDVADRKLLGDLPQELAGGPVRLCIDHHISNTRYAKNLCWDPNASAACEILFHLIQADSTLRLTEQLAVCLYIGMATDTGCFRFSNAGADTFDAVAQIKRAFPDLPYARINREMFVLKSRGRIALDSRLMQNIRFSADGRVALIYLPDAWMQEYSVTPAEVDSAANLPMQVMGVEIGMICKQQPDGSFRVSLRAGETADVSVIAKHFGGGGHVKAAGCTIADGEPEDVCRMLMDTAAAMLHRQEQP